MSGGNASRIGDSDDPCWEDMTPEQKRAAQGKLPLEERNRNVKCKGRTVIRHSRDHEDPELRGQPILDADGARQYRPCEAWAAHGTEYCVSHGGSAPQTIAAAKRELSLGALEFAAALRAIAKDERIPPDTRLKAINSGLDRIGIRTGVDVALEAPGWQKMLAEEFGQAFGDEEPEIPTPPETPPPPARASEATIKARVRKITNQAEAPPAKSKKATPPPAKPKFEGW